MIEKADVALAIAVLSAVFTGWQAIYTRRLAKNDTERMKRRKLIIEKHFEPMPDQPEWHRLRLTCRNLEPIAARVLAIRAKGPRLALLDYEDAYEGNSFAPNLKNPLPTELAKPRLDVTRDVSASTQAQSEWGGGPVQHIYCFTRGPALPEYLEVSWEWSDGQAI